MKQSTLFKPEEVDPEDFSDVIEKIGTSLEVRFKNTAFREVKTFGELCAVIEQYALGNHTIHEESCTTQHAFYKLRNAIAETLKLDSRTVKPGSLLDPFLPENIDGKH